MESKFKVGDKVVCVNNKDVEDDLEEGKEYTIMYVENRPRPAGDTYPRQVGVFAAHSEWADFRFELVKQPTNGTDAEGSPLHFTQDMLKPFMRVERQEGTFGIFLGKTEKGDAHVVGDFLNGSTWASCFQFDGGAFDEYAKTVAVYAAPYGADYLNPNKLGDLLWKRNPPKTAEQLAQEEAVAERKAAIEEAEKALKQAQEALDKLKGTV